MLCCSCDVVFSVNKKVKGGQRAETGDDREVRVKSSPARLVKTRHVNEYALAKTAGEYITVIPQARARYELAITILYPTSTSGITVSLKTHKEVSQNRPQLLRRRRARLMY